ncbi:hypothetical protein [Helicobacter sp. 23-1045]
MEQNTKKVIDYALNCIEKNNCLPTTKQSAQELGINEIEVDKIKADTKYKDFIKLRKRFNSFDKERKADFGGFRAFYEWYSAQEPKCYYCGTTQAQLEQLFNDELILSTKFNPTLHIEQKTPKQGYKSTNRVLACALCNNAKSDMISDENFRAYFADCVRKFVADLLSGKITNDIRGIE